MHNIRNVSLDLDDGRKLYSCGKLSHNDNGRLCTRFQLEDNPRDEFARRLKELVQGEINVTANYTYCSYEGNHWNTGTIQCFSTPSMDEINTYRYEIKQLALDKFYDNDDNLITCPPGITQCFKYGKDVYFSFCLVLIPHLRV